MVWLHCWFACVHETPPELRLDAARAEVEEPEPGEPQARLVWILHGDPLVRRPRMPAGDPDPALADWLAVARQGDPRADSWWALEATHRGTVVVPLSRGARLAAIEPRFPEFTTSVAWMVPLPVPTLKVEAARAPLDWLQVQRPEDVLTMMERQVLSGWLDGPGVDVTLVARPLGDATWARLAQTPAGRLIGARAAATGAGSSDALVEATRLALMEVAADTDAEQAAWRALRGNEGDPVNARLQEVGIDGRDAAATGRSLLALAALRWRDACEDTPCGGMDRVDLMGVAARWDPAVAPFAHAWQVIALKDAVDQLLTTYDTPFARLGVDRVVEALIGLGVTGMDLTVLQYREPGPGMHLAVSRALGAGDQTSKDAMFAALNRRLQAIAEAAAGEAPAALQEPLRRIAVRARREAGG